MCSRGVVCPLGPLCPLRSPAPSLPPPAGIHYFTHLLFNTDGSRFMFWYRCTAPDGGSPLRCSGVYSASPDGTDICLLNDRNSHCTWCGPDHVLAWATHKGTGPTSFLFTDRSNEFEHFGAGMFEFNAHASFSPDRRWLLGDIPHGKRLVLYHCEERRRVDFAQLDALPGLEGPLRCDLHPRWDRTGTRVCVDAIHTGSRQMILFDVTDIVTGG